MTNIARKLNYDKTEKNQANDSNVELGGLHILDSNGMLQNLLNLSTKKLTAILIENKYS